MRAGSVDATSVEPKAAQSPIVLSLDVGTSSARTLVYDSTGRSLSGLQSHRPFPVRTTPDGGVVIDPDMLLDVVGSVLDEIMALCSGGPAIAAVACDTFWHSLMGIDAGGRAVTPVYTWADTRSSGAAQELRSLVNADAVHARTGCVLHSSYWPAKLRWLREIQPSEFGRVASWISFSEYLYAALFGKRAVSISMASGTGLLDQASCSWDGELLSVLSIGLGQLSPLSEYSDTMEGLLPQYARRWPALSSVPWYLPLGDGGCNNVGTAGWDPRTVVIMIGTSGAIRVTRRAKDAASARGIWTYHLDRSWVVQGGALSDGGNLFAWLTQTLRTAAVPALETQLTAMSPDSHGLTVLPFLAGERSPDWNPLAMSAFVGMTLDTQPAHLVRATLEAVAYRFAAVYAELKRIIPPPRGMIGSGAGLLHSPVWLQIMTDVMGEPMAVSAVPEASSRGAALMVLEAMGMVPDRGALPAPTGQIYTPVPAHQETYARAIERQRKLYEALIPSPGERASQ